MSYITTSYCYCMPSSASGIYVWVSIPIWAQILVMVEILLNFEDLFFIMFYDTRTCILEGVYEWKWQLPDRYFFFLEFRNIIHM